jgi:hypothetical protein
MKVFISWSGNTSRNVAQFLREWILYIIQSVEPWMSATDIDAGTRWSRSVETQLSDTRFGIICLTRTNTSAPWVLFETGALAKTINKALAGDALPEAQLKKTFAKWWPDLKAVLDNLTPETTVENPARSPESKLDEILETVRDLSRRTRSGLGLRRRHTLTEDLRAGFDNWKSPEIAIGEKIEEYEALTEKSAFTIEVFYEPLKNQYFGRLTAFPAELPEVKEGESDPVLKSTEPITVGGADKDYLIDLFKSIIGQVGGSITSFARRQ